MGPESAPGSPSWSAAWVGVGTLTCLASKAECGQGQQGDECEGPHAVALCVRPSVCGSAAAQDSAGLPFQPPAPFIAPGPCPVGSRRAGAGEGDGRPARGVGGSWRSLPGLFGGHPPWLCGPNPRGCCGWELRCLGKAPGVLQRVGQWRQPGSQHCLSPCPMTLALPTQPQRPPARLGYRKSLERKGGCEV